MQQLAGCTGRALPKPSSGGMPGDGPSKAGHGIRQHDYMIGVRPATYVQQKAAARAARDGCACGHLPARAARCRQTTTRFVLPSSPNTGPPLPCYSKKASTAKLQPATTAAAGAATPHPATAMWPHLLLRRAGLLRMVAATALQPLPPLGPPMQGCYWGAATAPPALPPAAPPPLRVPSGPPTLLNRRLPSTRRLQELLTRRC